MTGWKVNMFGKLNIEGGGDMGIKARKVQELFSYLLLFRNRPHLRELLSENLWGNQSALESRKKMRQTLWRLRVALNGKSSMAPELHIDNEWIQINLPLNFQLDTAEFENAFNYVNQRGAKELKADDLKVMQSAVELYKGDLLEGWYQDWCILERERFQVMHLMLLDKLVQYCELHRKYEAGLYYAMEVLRYDRAYERAHRQMMRLYMLTGNRTQALHQYEHCAAALNAELGVEPSANTKELYEQIQLDTFKPPVIDNEKKNIRTSEKVTPNLRSVLNDLGRISAKLSALEYQIQAELATHGDVLPD